MNPSIKKYKNKIQVLMRKIERLEQRNEELEYIIEYKIKTAKTFKIWQTYNKIKRKIPYLLFLPIRLVFGIIYFFYFLLFFILNKLCSFLLFHKKKQMSFKKSEMYLNGVSFIIPTWNKKELVIQCVKTLYTVLGKEHKNIQIEVIIIDNGSTDGTYSAINKLQNKIDNLKIIRFEHNLGFAKAVNNAAEEASYNYIYLLNNDMLVQHGFFSPLVEFVQQQIKREQVFFGISSQIFFYDNTKRREESGKTFIKPFMGYMYIASCLEEYNLLAPSITAYLGGGSSLINKHVFLKLGGYDWQTFKPLYVEDVDLSYNAWKLGYPSYFIPNSKVIHYHRSSSKKLDRDPSYYMYKNWLAFIWKNVEDLEEISKHLVLYPLRIILNANYMKYALDVIMNSYSIFIMKLQKNKYKTVYSDKELFNFISFELTHDQFTV